MGASAAGGVAVLIPVFNDWECVDLLLPLLDQAMARRDKVRVLLVDDGSTCVPPPRLGQRAYRNIDQVDILHLSRNLGHQRAIAIGLYHIYKHVRCDKVVVMDADGQDSPAQAAVLLDIAAEHPGEVVFAARTKRLESFAFRIGYKLYRLIHRIATGISVRVGNFSVLPWEALERLVAVSDLWSHYAAAVFRSRIPFRTLPLSRGRRLVGNSRMRYSGLLVHALSAICVFGDVVSARALAFTAALTILTGGTTVAGLCYHWLTGWSIPVWARYVAPVAVVLSAQALAFAILLAFMVIASRGQMSFLPLRDGKYFVRGTTSLYPNPRAISEEPQIQLVAFEQ